jgi:hypothetical protein
MFQKQYLARPFLDRDPKFFKGLHSIYLIFCLFERACFAAGLTEPIFRAIELVILFLRIKTENLKKWPLRLDMLFQTK